MLKYKNFFLMLKQGIKGIFKFKIQFIIIVLLAFIATFILSVTLSTQKKLTDSYNDVVKKVDPFDYSGQLRVDTKVGGDSNPFLVLNILDNTGATRIVDNQDDVSKRDDSSYNFIYYNDGNYKVNDYQGNEVAYESFLTEGTNNFINWAKANPSSSVNDDIYMNLYNNYIKKLLIDLKKISSISLNGGSLNSFNNQTKYSAIGMYTFNNPHWFDESVSFGDPENPVITDFVNPKNRDVLDMVAATVGQFVVYQKNIIDFYNSNNQEKISNVAQLVGFLFGVKVDDSVNENWIISENNKQFTLNPTYDGSNKDFTFAIQDKSKSSNSAIWNSGLRGITNPFINNDPSNITNSTTVFSWNYYGNMNINSGDRGRTLLSNMDNFDNNYWNYITSNDLYETLLKNMISDASRIDNSFYNYNENVTAYTSYNKIAAGAAGFDYGIRRETDYFDSVSQLKFRAIILDPNEFYGLKIFKGRMPAVGEILINEQFAKKNHKKVGSSIEVGDAFYTISGIATDAFSFTPSQDIDNPIPNPSSSAFIWGWPATIKKMIGGTASNDTTTDSTDDMRQWFLWNTSTNLNNMDVRKDAFLGFYSNYIDNLGENQKAIKEYVDKGTISNNVDSNLNISSFSKSNFRYSWILEPLVLKIYDSVVFIAAGIIALVAIISLIVSVKKTVEFNSKQIGILKALGEKPSTISATYLSNSIILLVCVIPISWIIGIFVQIPFGNLFSNYFSIAPDNIVWDWISIVIAIGVLGILSGLVSFLSALILTKRPILKVLTQSTKWGRLRLVDALKKHVFGRASFSARFSMTLTSSGSRQITLMSVVTLLASFLISISLAIPAVVTKVSSSYYNSINYSNKYNEINMIGNAPLSKNAITYWNGQEYLDSQYVKTDDSLDGSSIKFGYYQNPEDYTSTITNSDVVSQYMYDKQNNKFQDANLYIISHMNDLLKTFGAMFGNNFFTHLGVSFSVGDVDKFYGILLHSLTNVEDTKGVITTDKEKMDQAKTLSGWFTTSVPKVINSIIDNIIPGASSNGDTSGKSWKQQILDVLYAVLPSYVRAYVEKSDSRQDQYAIAYQNEIYIPGEETLATSVDYSKDLVRGKNQSLTLTGLDKYQNSILIAKKSIENAYLPNDLKEQLYDRLNLPIKDGKVDISLRDKSVKTAEGYVLYDGSTHTLNIPVIVNRQAESAYKLEEGKILPGWTNNLQRLQVKLNSNYYDLPQNAWVYDDSDFVNYWSTKMKSTVTEGLKDRAPYLDGVQYSSSTPNKQWVYDEASDPTNSADTRYYLDPANLDNGKLTFNNQFDSDGNLNDNATLFKSFKTDKNENLSGTYLRPYYQYKNFKLMIPEVWIDDLNWFLWNHGYNTFDGNPTKDWYSEIPYSDVPKSVSDGYQKLAESQSDGSLNWSDASKNDSKWLVINPYDTDYFKDGYNEQSNRQPLGNILDGPGYWYRYIFSNDGEHPIQVLANAPVEQYLTESGAAPDIKINLQSVGTIDSYNDKLVICDSDLANLLLGYSNGRAYQYNQQIFDKDTLVPAGVEDQKSKTTSIYDRWMPLSEDQTTSGNFVDHDWASTAAKDSNLWRPAKMDPKEDILDYAPHVFYNTKLSNIDEPLNLTSQISFSKKVRVGQAAIQLGDSIKGSEANMIDNSELLSTVRALTNQILALAISIGAMLVIAIIVTAALLTMLTGDIYIEQYKRFMVLLRAMGYSNTKIMGYTFGTVSVLSFAAWIFGTICAWLLVFGFVQILWNAGFAIPVGFTWWPVLLSLIVVGASYVGSLWVSSMKARHENPSLVLTATAE